MTFRNSYLDGLDRLVIQHLGQILGLAVGLILGKDVLEGMATQPHASGGIWGRGAMSRPKTRGRNRRMTALSYHEREREKRKEKKNNNNTFVALFHMVASPLTAMRRCLLCLNSGALEGMTCSISYPLSVWISGSRLRHSTGSWPMYLPTG